MKKLIITKCLNRIQLASILRNLNKEFKCSSLTELLYLFNKLPLEVGYFELPDQVIASKFNEVAEYTYLEELDDDYFHYGMSSAEIQALKDAADWYNNLPIYDKEKVNCLIKHYSRGPIG